MGKSSLVREMCAPLEADGLISHAGEGTMSTQVHQNCGGADRNWTVRDAPGYGTAAFPSGAEIFKDLKSETDHVLLCVGHRIYTQDLEFYNRIPLNVPVTLVRLKCDLHACSDNQLRYLGANVFKGTTVFGVSTVKEHVRYGEIAKLMDYVENYDSLRG